MIDVKNVRFGYGREAVIDRISCVMNNGEVTGLIGPNGAGKSTLLRLCAGICKPQEGGIMVDGQPKYNAKAFARQLAFLPQSRPTPDITVRALVQMGRFAHGTGDREAVEQAIQTVGLQKAAECDVRTLSGGQRQMAYLAMLLAQESPNVLLDEPFTHLDIGAQLDVAHVIRRMKQSGKCVVVVLHDLNMLETVCDRVLLLNQGTIRFDGSPENCLQSQELEKAFDVRILANKGISFEKR